MHRKSHFLTCNFLMCLLHFWFDMSDFLMGLLHFLFLFFLGCPDGLQERFSVILVPLWEPLGRSWGVLGVRWAYLERPLEPPWHHFGDHVDILGRSEALSWLSWRVFGPNFNNFDVQIKKI